MFLGTQVFLLTGQVVRGVQSVYDGTIWSPMVSVVITGQVRLWCRLATSL